MRRREAAGPQNPVEWTAPPLWLDGHHPSGFRLVNGAMPGRNSPKMQLSPLPRRSCRHHRLKKKRHQREASGASTVYQRSNRRRTGAYDMSTLDPNSRRNRATATQTLDTDNESATSEHINRLVHEASKDSETPVWTETISLVLSFSNYPDI